MEENYFLAKQIASKRVNQNEGSYPFFVLAIYGLLNAYPGWTELIEEVFLETEFWIEDDTINGILERHDMDPEDFSCCIDGDSVCEDEHFSYGLAIADQDFYFDCNDCSFITKEVKPKIICSSLNTNNPAPVLMTFMHEMGHLIKSKINSSCFIFNDDSTGYKVRSGLNICETYYYPDDDVFVEIDSYNIVDEVINSLMTTQAGLSVYHLEGIIPDSNINNFFNTLDLDDMIEDTGYSFVSDHFKCFWADLEFRQIIKDNIVTGDIDKIINYFDSHTYPGCLDKLDDLLNDMDRLDADDKIKTFEMTEKLAKYITIVRKFKKNTKKHVKKKNFSNN